MFSSSSKATIQSWEKKKGRIAESSSTVPCLNSTIQSQSFVKKGGLLLILYPALERPDKQSLDWIGKCAIWRFFWLLTYWLMIHLLRSMILPWGRRLLFPSCEDHNFSFSLLYIYIQVKSLECVSWHDMRRNSQTGIRAFFVKQSWLVSPEESRSRVRGGQRKE